ncbi:RNA polymerase sigma factor SigI [Paenibacillus sp. IB182496]|uniref:RNA polymerase sigma factor SigI n=1 Tax=Paenibacillus sabuli TaxID=2772509 RepID=A0A927GQX3_9BACL|nr:RNA polymerase sigma factor SigI [Paenibacillus sabuli]
MFQRWLGRIRAEKPARATGREAPEAIVVRIQGGDTALQERFIAAYRPFVARVTSGFSKRYIDRTRDDEFSVALSAFHEAIQQFAPGAGRGFLGFAETVIRRRLIDHVRKEQRHANVLPYCTMQADTEEEPPHPVEVGEALRHYRAGREAEERRHEIGEFGVQLASYGITLSELAAVSPKHADSRRMLLGVAAELAADDSLYRSLHDKKQLPIKALLHKSAVSRKTLERHRKYLIALTLVYRGDYPFMQSYLHIPHARTEAAQRREGGGR